MMKSVFFSDGSIHVGSAPTPQQAEPHDVIVKIAYASICGYDLMMYRGQASYTEKKIIGHEASGTVVSIGENVTGIAVGDRVTLEPIQACRVCSACKKGKPEYCKNPRSLGNFMAEFAVCGEHQVPRIPDNLSLKEACLTEPIVMSLYAVEKACSRGGDSLLILGGGGMGMLMLLVAQHYGFSTIAVADPHKNKRHLALTLGASYTIDTKTDNAVSEAMELSNFEGFDAVIEASGSRSSAASAMQMLARGGVLVYFGMYGMEYDMPLNLFNLYWKDAMITGVNMPVFHFPKAISLLPKLQVERVITGLYPIDEAAEAFRIKDKGEHIKVMLEIDSGQDNAAPQINQ